MIEVQFKRAARSLSWPVPGGSRTVEAFSDVRNELNGKRPDPSRLPDVVRGIKKDRTRGPVVMPRPYPTGSWEIYGVELSTDKWTSPAKILTRANQWLDVWSVDPITGQYMQKSGAQFSDWCYWIHYANGSHWTEGCIGVVSLDDFKEFWRMVQIALDSRIPLSITALE